jgi:hypothetical protein
MLAIFVANITGALFFWHIAAEGGCEHHDCDNCPICQNTLINSAKIINISSDATNDINIVTYAISYESDDPIIIQSSCNIMPRAPPA